MKRHLRLCPPVRNQVVRNRRCAFLVFLGIVDTCGRVARVHFDSVAVFAGVQIARRVCSKWVMHHDGCRSVTGVSHKRAPGRGFFVSKERALLQLCAFIGFEVVAVYVFLCRWKRAWPATLRVAAVVRAALIVLKRRYSSRVYLVWINLYFNFNVFSFVNITLIFCHFVLPGFAVFVGAALNLAIVRCCIRHLLTILVTYFQIGVTQLFYIVDYIACFVQVIVNCAFNAFCAFLWCNACVLIPMYKHGVVVTGVRISKLCFQQFVRCIHVFVIFYQRHTCR